VIIPLFSALIPLLGFSSSKPLAIADITPMKKRGTGYGIFNTAYGLAVFAGSAAMGLLYDLSLTWLIGLGMAMELVALVVFAFLRREALSRETEVRRASIELAGSESAIRAGAIAADAPYFSRERKMRDDQGRYAQVRVEGEDHLVVIPVSSRKPDISDQVQDRWQKVVDFVARLFGVPSCLITRFTEEQLVVLAASRTEGNPYRNDARDKLGIGMFCETVVGKRREVQVDDIARSEYWARNPHAGLGMKSYLGVPIQWDDGELFGTFCVLSDKANEFMPGFIELMRQFKEIVEADLRCALLRSELEERLDAKELELREMRHRLKNQFNLLISYIDLHSRTDSRLEVKEVLQEVEHRVMALSLVNEELREPALGSTMSLDLYLRRLCDYILEDFAQEDLSIEYAIEPFRAASEKATSIALIVSELLTNSIKHAFPEGWPGTKGISIALESEGENGLSMVYRDSGSGFPEGFDPQKAKSLGMLLVGALVKQLGGSMLVENAGGAKLSFRFAA
jgi:two-component sensor histidine kinase